VFLVDFWGQALAKFVEEFSGGILLFDPVGGIYTQEFVEILFREREAVECERTGRGDVADGSLGCGGAG